MRSVLVSFVASCALVACHGDRLVGPEAQAAVRAHLRHHPAFRLPSDGVLLVVDGVVVSDPATFTIRPEQVSSVEIIKGSVPVRVIVTTKTATVTP
ncbi:MAG: hypothetical protein ACREL9_08065 [Gemmatimonadales bacterium]